MNKTSYRPWLMLAFAMLMLLVSNGMILSGLSAFDKSLLAEFGWNRGTLKARDLITLLATGLAAPFIGAVIDRIGVRRLILVGAAVLSLAYYLYSRVGSPMEVYGIHLLFAIVLVGCGLNVGVILVSNWFEAKRGTALGIAIMGTSVGGMIFPPLITQLVSSQGWRAAFVTLAAVPAVLLVLAALVVRSRPADVGELAFGAGTASKAGAPQGLSSGLSFGEALRTPTFWILCFTACMTFYAMMSAMAHLFLHMQDLGFAPPVAAKALSLMFGLALVGKLVFGALSDWLDQKLVYLANLAVMLSGAVALATLKVDWVWIAVGLFGLGWGGMYTMLQLQAINAFGLKAAGKVLGTLVMVEAIGGGVGIFATGVLFDIHKNYQLAFGLICVLLTLSLLASTRVKRLQLG
ncbi:MFS transporter [Paucibacter sp. JuS9]|uniref:MFS transporter n=1 Tax=Paucibacter sp. JuS9 TaxID=3228748 RepID=UPI0037582AC9